MQIENLVRREVQKLAPYIPGQSAKDVKKSLGLTKVINLSTNESVLKVSNRVRDALTSDLNTINQYPDGSSRLLRNDIASRYNLDPDMLIITNGGDELIYLLCACFISPGEEIVIGEYGFSTYAIAGQIYGANIRKVSLKNGYLDLPGMAEQVNRKTKMIFLCNPHNPDGTIFDYRSFKSFLNKIPENIIIVLDEAYADFVENPEFPDSNNLIKNNNHHIISLRTFSKIGGMAGLRIGFGIARRELINYLRKVQPPYSVNRLAQVAARAFLSDENYRDRLLKNNKQGKQYLYRQFNRLRLFYYPTEANFIFVDVRVDADIICKKLIEKGIIVRSGKVWGKDTWIRVTIGTEKHVRSFIKALEEILSES